MSESMPPTLVQMQKMQRDLAEKVLDKACEDPQWKQQLIEDPELALREADFPEFKRLQEAAQPDGAGVQGQEWPDDRGSWGASAWRYPSHGWWW